MTEGEESGREEEEQRGGFRERKREGRQGQARERVTHTHTIKYTAIHTCCLCNTPSHTRSSHVCAEAERCLVWEVHLPPPDPSSPHPTITSPLQTQGHALCSWTQQKPDWTTVTHRWRLSAGKQRLHHRPLLPLSLCVSFHSFIPRSPISEAARVAEGHIALRSAVGELESPMR